MMSESYILVGDVRDALSAIPERSIQCCVTSPPYWGLRDYGVVGQLGLEATPEEYIANMVEVFREVRRVLRDDGTLWLNIGDSYASGGRGGLGDKCGLNGSRNNQNESRKAVAVMGRSIPRGYKPKDLVGIPWMLAFALRADGWYLRSDIIWSKPNPMPESVTDRPTKAHEYLFLLTKSPRYYYDAEAVKEPDKGTDHRRNILHKPEPSGGLLTPHQGIRTTEGRNGAGRNRRSVWTVATQPFRGAHFAVFPPALIEPCILAGCPAGGSVLDPFFGAGTTGLVAQRLGRDWVGVEINEEYALMALRRIEEDAL